MIEEGNVLQEQYLLKIVYVYTSYSTGDISVLNENWCLHLHLNKAIGNFTNVLLKCM